MTTFTYTARGAAGVQVHGTLAVANRDAALRELKRMGLVPSQVVEATPGTVAQSASGSPGLPGTVPRSGSGSPSLPGTVPRSGSGSPGAPSPSRISIPIAGLILLLFIACGWWWLAREPSAAVTQADPAHSARVEPAASTGQVAVVSPKPAPRVASALPAVITAPPPVAMAAKPVEPVKALTINAPPERKTIRISLTPPVYDKEGNEIHPEPAFKTDTEIALSSILSTPPGVEPIDMSPPDDEEDVEGAQAEDVARTLANVIVITENDDESMAEHKENVGWAKLGMAEAMKGGYKAGDYVKALYEQIKAESKERQELMQMLEKVAQTSDEKTTLAALEEANKYLKENNRPVIDKSEIIEEEPEE